ncbi:MAG: protoheme IX farnesyltransferase, partial [Minisyncoccia bacterium]
MIKDYYSLTKPGIIYGNAITVVAGFMLASKGAPDWWL